MFSLESLRVAYTGTTRFVATDREPRPLEVTLICEAGLEAGAEVRVCTTTFHTHTPEWRLDAIRVEGGDGHLVLGHGLPQGWQEKTRGGVGPAGGALVGRPVGEVYLCTAQVRQSLTPGARVIFDFGVVGSPFADVAGGLRVKVRAADAEGFRQVGDDIPLHNTCGPPERLEARAAADASTGVRLVVFATDALLNPVPAYRATLKLQVSPDSGAPKETPSLPSAVETDDDGRAVVDAMPVTGDRAVRIQVDDEVTGWSAQTGPLLAAPAGGLRHLFGALHFHTVLSVDGDRDPRAAYAYARDHLQLDVLAMADHAPVGAAWEECLAVNEEFDEPGRFVTLPGWESANAYGHANVYLRSPDADAGPWRWDPDVCPSQVAWPEDAIVVPHHPNAGQTFAPGTHREVLSQGIYWTRYDWSIANPRVRLVEIVQQRGCFEADAVSEDWGIRIAGHGCSVQDALARGWRLGFVAGTDNHKGHPTQGEGGTYVGTTCFRAAERTREAVWQAMDSRRTYATSGVPIVCDFAVNGVAAGGEAQLEEGGEVHFDACLHGTAPIALVEVISGGQCVWCQTPEIWDVELSGIELPPPSGPSAYYYLRLRQADGHRAWLSPVWIDRDEA